MLMETTLKNLRKGAETHKYSQIINFTFISFIRLLKFL